MKRFACTRSTMTVVGKAIAMAMIVLALSASNALAQQSQGQTPGQVALQALVEQAKKEPNVVNGHITLALIPLAAKANQLFNQKFGLNKTINIVSGVDNTFISQMISALDVGSKPGLSFYATNGGDMPMFITGGYAAYTKDWDILLTEINPRVKSGAIKPGDISRAGYAGYAFAHSNRLKGVGYNTKLASPKDLPQTYAEIADPKYKGQYAVEPWTSHWEALGYNYYPDRMGQFYDLMNKIGQNAYVVSRSHQLVPRMTLGEIKFMTLNAEVVADFTAKNPSAPLDYYFMKDMTLLETTLVFLPRNGPAPATAALWAMFLSNPEVQALRAPDAPNIMYGEKPSDMKMKERLQGKNLWDWEMNESTTAYWHWTNAKENEEFRSKVLKAVKQQH